MLVLLWWQQSVALFMIIIMIMMSNRSKAWMKTITQQGDSYVVYEVPVAACMKTATY